MQIDSFDPEWAAPGDWAAMYRAAGLQVVPARLPEPGTQWKIPALGWKEYQENLAPDATFERWFGRNGEYATRDNMGLITGRASGNVFVIDLDEYKTDDALAWWRGILAVDNNNVEPETCQQITGGGGRQLFFKAPEGWRAPTNKTPIGVDIRGQGGFAVLPPSRHVSGKAYTWKPGAAPWECEIALAPDWLLQAVVDLVERYGGDQNRDTTQGPVTRTASPQSDLDAFGARVDGRDHYMRDLIWAAVANWRRECPIHPTEAEIQAKAREVWQVYERKTKTRLPGDNTAGLEREGRGPTAFAEKWRRAMSKWSTDIAEAAQRPLERDEWKEATAPLVPATQPAALFEFLNIAQIKTIPDPRWLVSGLVIEQALGFIYGPPGCLKTFIALGMGLSFAVGMPDWWGRKIERKGAVVYISSEGQSDLKFRIEAWEKHNQVEADESPFYLIRQTINFMKAEDVDKLIATVQAISDVAGPIAAVFVDTVSRVLPGADENMQKDMTLFVAACDAVRQRFEATVIGVHHTSRNGNMRGSTVFPGAGDFLVEVRRETGAKHGSIFAEKIKAGEDGWEQNFKVEEIQLGGIGGNKSLVVCASDEKKAEVEPGKWPSDEVCKLILSDIRTAWFAGRPWSTSSNTAKEGRYANRLLVLNYGVTQNIADHMIETWLTSRPPVLAVETVNTNTKLKGLKIVGGIC